ncbi:MAG: TetR/AcrR family transcriptional regulator [Ignavibacteriaceae bacterium]
MLSVNLKEIEDDKTRILKYAQAKYLTEGFYKTSMDVLASEMQISKKTIYKHFTTKNHLVEAVVQDTMKYMSLKIDEIINSDQDAILKILQLLDYMSKSILRASEKWMIDVKQHMPALWNKIDKFRSKKMLVILSKIIEQGKIEGYIEDKPNEIIITIFIASIRAIINPTFLSENKLTFHEVLPITFEILLKGILTEKGTELYYKSIPVILGKI